MYFKHKVSHISREYFVTKYNPLTQIYGRNIRNSEYYLQLQKDVNKEPGRNLPDCKIPESRDVTRKLLKFAKTAAGADSE
jgi:hypothetical protein